jgi:hypothetical protein
LRRIGLKLFQHLYVESVQLRLPFSFHGHPLNRRPVADSN